MKVGDRVKIIKSLSNHYNQIGIIRHIYSKNESGVEFKEPFDGGHNLEWHCDDGHGWYYSNRFLEVVGAEIYHYCNPLCSKCMKNPREAVIF